MGDEPNYYDAECDLDSPLYHAPNRCEDDNCLFPQCQEDGADDDILAEPADLIWWKTHDNWNENELGEDQNGGAS